MGQFIKNWTRKDIAMDVAKLLEDSDPLIGAPELNERLPEKIQNVFIISSQSLDQRKNARNTESSILSSYVLSSFALKFYCQTCILHVQINNSFMSF